MPKQNLTIDDIARELGVSKTTVSRAISGKGRISDATRKKVMAYIETCNYRPSAAAKGLAESRTYNLALVLPKSFIQLDLPYIRQIMNAICEEAFVWDYNILICLSTDSCPESLLRTLDNRKVDGVILSRTVDNDALVDILRNRDIPFATIGSLPPHTEGLATVEADHDQVGGCHAFSLTVLQSDPDMIGVLGNDMRYVVNQSRLTGFRQAVEEMGYPKKRICLRTELGTPQEIYNAVEQLLESGVRHFLAMDDDICISVVQKLERSGFKIPEDVKVFSLFDSAKIRSLQLPIPVLRFDAAELGHIACRELLRHLRNENYDSKPVLGYRIIL